MVALKQEILAVDKYARARFRVDEPSGKVTYFDDVNDALKVGGSIAGSKTYLEITLAINKG